VSAAAYSSFASRAPGICGFFASVFVYDFGREDFRLKRHISAQRARWDAAQRSWVFVTGWVRNIDDRGAIQFEQFESRAFADLVEDPDYFLKEDVLHQQMNWEQLGAYIQDLTQAGFDTVRLKVQWHKKLAFPAFAFCMALMAVPFAMIAGHRGALSGVSLSLILAIAYYAIAALFEQLGRVNQMTPLMAAWAPSLIFAFGGGYLFLRVRT
jgi:lipopolysaccharide export LptBFGC system permease protein LptF